MQLKSPRQRAWTAPPRVNLRRVRYNAPVGALPSELVYAVQDLYDLFQRHNPLGGYRYSLFHDAPAPEPAWPAAAAAGQRAALTLARGVSCLLASGLPEAALALTGALWQSQLSLERALAGSHWREPEYYRYLTAELARPGAGETAAEEAYRLFGEVLAVQLDLIAQLEAPAERAALHQRVAQLRRQLK